MKKIPKKDYYTIAEVANILGLSRVAIFNRVKKGKIKAIKIGRNYAIPYKDLLNSIGYIIREPLTKEGEKMINASVTKIFKEYGDVIEKLGEE